MISGSIVSFVLIAWFVATLIYQFSLNSLSRWAARFDRFRLIPAWRFFSGQPRNLRVEYRHRRDDGSNSSWQVLDSPPRWRISAAVWNPQFMVSDVILTLAEILVGIVEHRPQNSKLEYTFPYRTLAHRVKCMGQGINAGTGEFRIVESSASGDDRVVFSSQRRTANT